MRIEDNIKAIYGVSKKDSKTAQREEVPFGPELKYVGALPTSHNYNFEEEILLKEDKIVEKILRDKDSSSNRYGYHEITYYTSDLNNYNYYILDYFEFDTRANLDYDYRTNQKVVTIDLANKDYLSANMNATEAKKFRLYYRKPKEEEPGYEDILIATKILNVSKITVSGVETYIEEYKWS